MSNSEFTQETLDEFKTIARESVAKVRKQGAFGIVWTVDKFRDDGEYRCAYRTPEGFGCAIGVFLSDETVAKMQATDEAELGVSEIWHWLPERLQKMPEAMLVELQKAHDMAAIEASRPYEHNIEVFSRDVESLIGWDISDWEIRDDRGPVAGL